MRTLKLTRSPSSLTSERLREMGYTVDVCERRLTATITQDLFGVFDLVAFRGSETLGIQCTSSSNRAARRKKVAAWPDIKNWTNRQVDRFAEVWSWRRKGKEDVVVRERFIAPKVWKVIGE